MDMRSNNRPPRKFAGKSGGGRAPGRTDGRKIGEFSERPARRPGDKQNWRTEDGRSQGGRPGGRTNWENDSRPGSDNKPGWNRDDDRGRRPGGKPGAKPSWNSGGKPTWKRDDRPARQEGDRPSYNGFEGGEGKPKWAAKGRPSGRPNSKFHSRSNWDPDSRPGRKPGGRPMGRSEGGQGRSFADASDWDQDDLVARGSNEERTGRFGSKPQWTAKGKPAAVRSEKPHRPQSDKSAKKQRAVTDSPSAKQPTHWSNVAEWYDELVGDEGSEYHQEVIIPGLVKMLNIAQGGEPLPRVLDLACGQGVLCRRLAEYGCTITGVDAAEELIAAARRRNEEDKLDIRYLVADVTQLIDDDDTLLPVIEAESYDVATIVLSIQNITPLTPVWLACRQALKPGGHLIIVMMHPCFRIPRKSDWFWDSASSTQSRLVSLYLSSDQIEIQTHPGLAAHGKDNSSTTHFHRPLQAYINTLGSAGLLVDHIEEWTSHKTEQPGPKKVAIDRARKEIPMFLAIRARKV